MAEVLTQEQRFPLLTEHGRRLLQWLHECEFAPRYTHRCGSRLSADGVYRVRAFADELSAAPKGWRFGEQPAWLAEFVAMCFDDVPFYRRYGARPANFTDIPITERADLSREPWAFVPDSQPLDDLILYATSGTTGHSLAVLSHPETAAKYLPLIQAALATRGVRMEGGPGRVACLLVCFQKSTLTYASASPLLADAGFAKINLHPNDWRDPGDIVRFLDACNPEVYTGDPLSFAELARLPLSTRPKALLSTAMMFLPGLRQQLEDRFGCPVLDLYSMNESGPIAVAPWPAAREHVLLQPRLYVEIVDAEGVPCPPGARGELALTGGFNPYIPLLRYRTNDYACLEFRDGQPVLMDLEGRPPTTFRRADGQVLNNVDVTIALRPFALSRYTLHQFADGALRLGLPREGVDRPRLGGVLLELFGSGQVLTLEDLDSTVSAGGKVIQYTRDEASD